MLPASSNRHCQGENCFALVLPHRKSTRNTSINPEMRSESTPDPSDAKQSHSVAAMSPHLISVKSGEEVEEKSEKKKKKKRTCR